MSAQEVIATAQASVAQWIGGLVLMCASVSVAPFGVVLARRIFPGRNIFFARWGFSHVALLVIVFIALAVLAQILQGESQFGALTLLLLQVLFFACLGALIFRFAHKLDPDGWRCLGLRADKNGRAIGVGLVGYVLAVPGLFGAALAWPWVLEKLGIEPSPQGVMELALALRGGQLALFVLLAVVVMPFLEELIFRAFLQPLLVQNLGDRGGVAVTAVFFAALHGATVFLPVCVLAIVLGSVMLRTQRLGAVWFIHALHNGLTLVLLLLVPGGRDVLGP